ncbi:hypothetical protein [Streptomyces sp. NBC_01361]|uniref:hypothetical protein n=1 Tax=Streptomyces sp. NBC_01361 TaxID=2903838 RepID=UPI002E359731|nr:hypothetical protein [Streptomyces sp. NBC_01361]
MPPTQQPPHHSITPATGHTSIVAGPAKPRTPKVQEALDARDALAGALSQAGVQLPAMDVRTPWAGEGEGESRYALVHLGVCSAPVALRLAAVIAKGVGS